MTVYDNMALRACAIAGDKAMTKSIAGPAPPPTSCNWATILTVWAKASCRAGKRQSGVAIGRVYAGDPKVFLFDEPLVQSRRGTSALLGA